MNTSSIDILDDFYRRHCNGDWEHDYGVKIETCDNPGWLLTSDDPDLQKELVAPQYDFIVEQISLERNVCINRDCFRNNRHEVLVFGDSLEIVLDVMAFLIQYLDQHRL